MAASEVVAVVGASHKRRIVAVGSTDEYEELCCLGAGGFGAVVKARHRATGKTVAIKRLIARKPNGGHRSDPEELLREAGLLRECAGVPSVVGFRGLARDPGTKDLCLVMEFVGPTLYGVLRDERRRLHGGPPLREDTVRAVMWRLLRGAKKMHARNVVHRDIKTENILVGDNHTAVTSRSLSNADHMLPFII
ncbi:hypothetical protein ACP4OV_007707 [Aristida adscensionis]